MPCAILAATSFPSLDKKSWAWSVECSTTGAMILGVGPDVSGIRCLAKIDEVPLPPQEVDMPAILKLPHGVTYPFHPRY